MKPAWLTGSTGLIGNYIVQAASRWGTQWRLRPLTHAQLDLLDFDRVEREFKKDRPELVIHCAGITTVAQAQNNPALARKLNVEATKFLAALCGDIQFVFLSTDVVFDGRKGHYKETDVPNPLHVYGETKLAAEQWVLKYPRHLVLRTSINGGTSITGNRGFNEQFWQAMESGKGMKLFIDEFRCPIFAGETARAVWQLAGQAAAGIIHAAGAQRLSRFEIGQLMLRRRPGIKATIESGLAKDFPGPPRVLDSSMDISKAQKLLPEPLPGLTEWFDAHPAEPF